MRVQQVSSHCHAPTSRAHATCNWLLFHRALDLAHPALQDAVQSSPATAVSSTCEVDEQAKNAAQGSVGMVSTALWVEARTDHPAI